MTIKAVRAAAALLLSLTAWRPDSAGIRVPEEGETPVPIGPGPGDPVR